jgi:hypothetical protein
MTRTAGQHPANIRKRRDRASDAHAAVAHELEVLAVRMTQVSHQWSWTDPKDQAAIEAAIPGVTFAAKVFRYLAVKAKGPS